MITHFFPDICYCFAYYYVGINKLFFFLHSLIVVLLMLQGVLNNWLCFTVSMASVHRDSCVFFKRDHLHGQPPPAPFHSSFVLSHLLQHLLCLLDESFRQKMFIILFSRIFSQNEACYSLFRLVWCTVFLYRYIII